MLRCTETQYTAVLCTVQNRNALLYKKRVHCCSLLCCTLRCCTIQKCSAVERPRREGEAWSVAFLGPCVAASWRTERLGAKREENELWAKRQGREIGKGEIGSEDMRFLSEKGLSDGFFKQGLFLQLQKEIE